MINNRTWAGVTSLLDNYVGVKADDTVLVLFTADSFQAAAWISTALNIREISVERVLMNPLVDEGFQQRLENALPKPESLPGRLVVLSFERDTMSHTHVLFNSLSRYDKSQCAVFRAISTCESLFATALQVKPEELSARNTAILERCMQAKKLHVKTEGGSDLRIELDSDKHRWISNRGMAKKGGVVVLPAGEVATYPASISGVHVADFAFNVNAITTKDTRLHTHPVTLLIKDNRVVNYRCDNPEILKFLDECFISHCAFNVGELGFGTNPKIVEPISLNSHINERRPGIHLGFGQHNQDPNVVGYQCQIHLDLIARGGLVWVDDDETPIDLENIIPSSNPHPINSRDEDVFSPDVLEFEMDDCCGILTDDGFQLSCEVNA